MTNEELEALANLIVEKVIAPLVKELRHTRRIAPKDDGMMTCAQAAAYLGKSREFIRRNRAELQPSLLGKHWRYSKESLDRFNQKRNVWIGKRHS